MPNSALCIISPYFDLISQSRAVHLQHWRGEQVQRCSLLSIKTGGCSEDCAYCAQSAHYSTAVEREELLSLENVCRKRASVWQRDAPSCRAKVRRSAFSPARIRFFYGNKLLTVKNPAADVDIALLRELGLRVEANQGATA